MTEKLQQYREELETELSNILEYWENNTQDKEHGGFEGRIDFQNRMYADAPKGAVLNARILWSFAAAYNLDPKHNLEMADRAYQYFVAHFLDHDYGGVFWTVDAKGDPLDTKKQVYAVAFAIYAFSEYFIASGYEVVKDHGIALYHELIEHAYDVEKGGFFEAFDREWKPLEDSRLSDKDANEKKTMNTHLHVLEAFANLYRVWPDEELKRHIIALLNNFITHIIDAETGNLVLFFDEEWTPKSEIISYGHDIEASWLLLEAAKAIDNEELVTTFKELAVKMAAVSLNGLDADGALWYEKELSVNYVIKEKHWWVQAEAMVGFFNAWQISGDEQLLTDSLNTWEYVKTHLLDTIHGEWFWGIGEDGLVMPNEDKAGLWKCPYHNSRACIEIIKRINAI